MYLTTNASQRKLEKRFNERYVRDYLDEIILRKILDEPIHPYGLRLYIKEEFCFLPDISSIYSRLHQLKKEGVIYSIKRKVNGRDRIECHASKSAPDYLRTLTNVSYRNREKMMRSTSSIFSVAMPEHIVQTKEL
jgi:DNA-binding PadR family transcriptional regulator